MELVRGGGPGDLCAGHQVVLGIDGPQGDSFARLPQIDRLRLGEHDLAPRQIGTRRPKLRNRHFNRVSTAHLLVELLLPGQLDFLLADQLRLARETPGDVPFRQVLGSGNDLFLLHRGRIVPQLGGHVSWYVDPQRIHAAVEDVVEERGLVIDGAVFDPCDEQLTDPDLRLATLGPEHEQRPFLRIGVSLYRTHLSQIAARRRHHAFQGRLGGDAAKSLGLLVDRIDKQVLRRVDDQPSGGTLHRVWGNLRNR